MGETETEGIGYEAWNEIVIVTEANLEIIEKNRIKSKLGKITETLTLERALKERDKYPEPAPDTMEETETPAETEEAPAKEAAPQETPAA